MSIDGIIMQSAPRKQTHSKNSKTSLLDNNYDGDNLHFRNRCAAPKNEVEMLYTKAFKEAVDSVPKQEIRITQTRTPYDLYLYATNRTTGKSIILHAKTMEVGFYTARVQVYQDGKSEILNWLKGEDTNHVMSQYRDLKKRLYNHIRT